jgi:hypothetical protein
MVYTINMTYDFYPPRHIKMTRKDDQPSRFTWRGKSHQICYTLRQWTVEYPHHLNRISHHYYKVVTSSGYLLNIYYDTLAKKWYVQKQYH